MEAELREEPLIGEQDLLDELSGQLAAVSQIAIDTEFVRESTYFPHLCLIQIATEELILGVDCLASLQLDPLFRSMFRPDATWVLHSARQDLEVLWNASQRLPESLFDTQLAAALVGYAPQIGLQELLAKTIGVELPKGHARTDWSRRPIDADALRYAIDDVRHLLAVRRHLEQRLIELDRLGWLEEDGARLLRERPIADPLTIWGRLKGVWRLDAAQRRAALALVRWRESEAEKRNRPRRWILGDELVTRLAQAMPDSYQALRSIAELPRRLATRSGREIVAAIHSADQAEISAALDGVRAPSTPDKTLLKMLQAEVKERAERLGIHPEVLATRRDLASLAAGETPRLLATGWRAEQLAGALEACRN